MVIHMINKRYILILLQAFLSVWAIMRLSRMAVGGIFALIFFLLLSFFYDQNTWSGIARNDTAVFRKIQYTSRIIAAFFALCCIFGGSSVILDGLEQKLFCFVILLVTGLGLYFIALYTLLYVYQRLFFFSPYQTSNTKASYRHFGFISFAVCLMGWSPYFLGNFPGVMTVDSFNQYAQAIGTYAYSNHHPWIHTLCIKLFYNLGLLFTDNPSIAISFYTVFQMLFMAFCVGCFVNLMVHLKVSVAVLWLTTLFFALTPYHGMFSVTIWKDVPFAGLFLLFGISLFRMILLKKTGEHLSAHPAYLCCFIITGILMSLMRSNGWYVFLFCVPLFLFYFRDEIKVVLPVNLIVIAIVIMIKNPVMNAFDVLQPDIVESLSIPIQQIARVIADGHELTSQNTVLLEQVVDISRISEEYDPHCSDNIKRLIRKGNQSYLNEHLPEYKALWQRLMIQYPGAYYQAFVDQTWGYWYPEGEYPVIFNETIPDNEFGLTAAPLFHGPLYIKLKEILFKLHSIIPLYSALFHMGTLFWIIIACAGLIVVKGKYRYLALYAPAFALTGTLMIAAPLYAELRYAYCLLFSMPLYILTALFCGSEELGMDRRCTTQTEV